jgi:hypothetical protein
MEGAKVGDEGPSSSASDVLNFEHHEHQGTPAEGCSDKALIKLIALLEELNVGTSSTESDEALIERIIEENRDVLARLAK